MVRKVPVLITVGGSGCNREHRLVSLLGRSVPLLSVACIVPGLVVGRGPVVQARGKQAVIVRSVFDSKHEGT